MDSKNGILREILNRLIGLERTERLFRTLVIHPSVIEETGPRLSRAALAQGLNMLLFEDLLERVPAAWMYVARCLRDGKTVKHDHGAVRTVAFANMGCLPPGEEAITRILRPLGYVLNGIYPLDRLRMMGRSYIQSDLPEEIAQFFISELFPKQFSLEFQAAVRRVTASSADPLTVEARVLLAELESMRTLTAHQAIALLPLLVACFGRQHPEISLSDYEILLAESAEMAWISTEGNAFNHATDRVPDVKQLSSEQRALKAPMKASIEVSSSGRVLQTAFHAARVVRRFRVEDKNYIEREVPRSFYEFITRLPLREQNSRTKLDLGFDSSNAQAIFKMTADPDVTAVAGK